MKCKQFVQAIKEKYAKYSGLVLLTMFLGIIIIMFFNYSVIIEINRGISSGNMLGLFILYFVEIIIFLIFYDALLLKLRGDISVEFDSFIENAILNNNPDRAIRIIKTVYLLQKITYKLRLWWVAYARTEKKNEVWENISRKSLIQQIIKLSRLILNVPAVIALLLTLVTGGMIKIDDVTKAESVKQAWDTVVNLRVDFSSLPVVLTIFTFILTFYFNMEKRRTRKFVDKHVNNKIELITIKNYELNFILQQMLFKASKNIEYVILRQNSIVEWILTENIKNKSKSIEINKSTENFILRSQLNHEKICTNNLDELFELKEVVQIFNCLYEEKYEILQKFYLNKYAIQEVIFNRTNITSIKKMEQIFFTKESLEKYVKEKSKENIEKADLHKELSKKICKGLELLYELFKYQEVIDSHLKSSKLEKLLKRFKTEKTE